jgi:hypothetical protein
MYSIDLIKVIFRMAADIRYLLWTFSTLLFGAIIIIILVILDSAVQLSLSTLVSQPAAPD